MKIKIGKIKKDATAYGNKYWIQIEDSSLTDNSDLEELVDKTVAVVIGRMKAIDDLIQEVAVL